MTFRGLAVFSLAAVFGSFESCQPPAAIRLEPKTVPPPLSLPIPVPSQPPAEQIPAEPIVPRSLTGGAPTLDDVLKPTATARDWTAIVIHHTATERGNVESIHEAHIAKEWLGIGYHFVIGNGNGMPDGEIEPTFRWREQLHGAHAGSDEYNQQGIGIALIGNFDQTPPTPAQLDAVKNLVGELKTQYEIDEERVIGHSEVKATACPGKLFPMEEVRQVMLSNRNRFSVDAAMRTAGWASEPFRSAARADHSGSLLP